MPTSVGMTGNDGPHVIHVTVRYYIITALKTWVVRLRGP